MVSLCFFASFSRTARLSFIPWWGMKRRFAPSVASCGMTLKASEPDCMVKATVVRIMAPPWALIRGSTLSSTGLNSQRFPNTSLSGKEA